MKYQDIIDKPHYEFKSHPRMPQAERASQFAPFAALDGYYDLVKEKSKILYYKKELSEEAKNKLDEKITYLESTLAKSPRVTIIYFKPITNKKGKYLKYRGIIKKIDRIKNTIIFQDKKIITISNIIEIK